MTDPVVGSPFALLHSPTRVIGVRAGPKEGTLLVTVLSQGVTLFSIATQSAIRTWHTRTNASQLTHAACFEPRAAQLLAVRCHTDVIGWDEAAEELSIDRSHTLPAPVRSLYHHAALLDGTLLTLSNGSVIVLNAALDDRLATVPPFAPQSTALWADLGVSRSGLILTQLLLGVDGELTVTRSRLSPKSERGVVGARSPLVAVTTDGAPNLLLRLGLAAPGRLLCGGCLQWLPPPRGRQAAGADSGPQATLTLMWDGGEMQLWQLPNNKVVAATTRNTPDPDDTKDAENAEEAVEAAPRPSICRHLCGLAPMRSAGNKADGHGGLLERRSQELAALTFHPHPYGLHTLRPQQTLFVGRIHPSDGLGLIESSGSLKDGMGSVALHVWDATYGMLRCQASLPIGRLLASGTRPMQDATIVDVCVLPVAGGSSSVSVVVAFASAVIVCRVHPPPAYCLAQALCATRRTASVLVPEEASSLITPPLCHAQPIEQLLELAPLKRVGDPLPLPPSELASSWGGHASASSELEREVAQPPTSCEPWCLSGACCDDPCGVPFKVSR